MSDRLSRRAFLFYGGATAAGITLGELGRRALVQADETAAAWRDQGLESWATSVCRECPAACGVRARLVDGVPVKLEGNPLCPIGRGRLCAKGQAALESYFDPDRLVGPARRAGEGRWQPVGWDEAAALLIQHMKKAPPGGIVAFAAEERGPVADAWNRFWTSAGAALAWTPLGTAAALAPALDALAGLHAPPLFDLEHATHVLSFGAPLVEDWLSPVWAQGSYGRFRRGDAHRRGRLVQVEDRRSLTARKADEWLPVHREAQVALAYGIATVLLRESRVDRSSLEAAGGDVGALEAQLVQRFSPDDVAAQTGIPVVTILRVARELVASPRPLVIASADAEPRLREAVLALDALLGRLEQPGGVFAGEPIPPAGAAAPAVLHEIAGGRLQPSVVAFRDASALRDLEALDDLGPALERAALVVSFSPFLDETAAFADLLLPVHTSLESWHAVVPAPALAADVRVVARPAVRARLDTRDLPAVLRQVAQGIGGAVASACEWQSSEDLAAAEIRAVWAQRRGAPYAGPYETEWLRQLESGGWWVPPAASVEAFQAAVLDAGGWVDPHAPSGAIQATLRARGGLSFPQPPDLPRPKLATDEYPLRLVAFLPAVLGRAGNPNQPVLFELLGQPDATPWRAWVEMAPETAHAHDLVQDATARLISVQGSVEATVVLVEGMPAETVALACVPAVPGGGRWARRFGSDARRLWRGGAASACRVRLGRA